MTQRRRSPDANIGAVVTGQVKTNATAHILIAAMALRRAGLPVFPLLPRQKKPRFKGAFRSATLDWRTIVDHWRTYPHDNIGIRPPKGMVVVDVDPRAAGDTALARLTDEHGPLPETWTARTGSGGWHYWYKIGDVDRIRGKLCRGIDLKHGGNGFVVAPPSIHPDGNVYEWVIPPYGQPTSAPVWLYEAMQPPRRPTHTVTGTVGGHGPFTCGCLVARIAAARQGSRNITLYGAMKDALRQGDLDLFEADLVAAAVGIGLDMSEIESTVRSVRGGGAR